MYADDLSAYAVGPKIQILCDRSNMYVPMSLQFFKEWDLVVSPEKSDNRISIFFVLMITVVSVRAFKL